jgi:DNA-binding NarL/FixJ family response regulator
VRNYIIADNRDITRAGLISYIKEIDTDFCLTEVNSYVGLLEELRMSPKSIVITDYSLFDFSSLAHMLNIKSGANKSTWLLFSEEPGEHFLRQLLLSDDSISVVLKNSSKKNITEALVAVKEDDVYWCEYAEAVMRSEIENAKPTINLTASEKKILHEIALGKTTKEIAVEKNLSFHTVNTHRRNIYSKLGVNSVNEATRYALQAGLIDLMEYYI